MSVVVLWASPNREGLTAECKNAAIKGVKESGFAVEEIHLNNLNIERCRVCGNGFGECLSKGHCAIDDAFDGLYNKMIKAQGLVIVSPVYWGDMSENLKSFLDRLRRCDFSANHYLNKKPCEIIAAAGGSGDGAIRCLGLMEDTLKNMGVSVVERLPVTQFSRKYMMQAIEASARELCARIGE